MSNFLRVGEGNAVGARVAGLGLRLLRNSHALVGQWRDRERRRAELRRLLRTGPHLVADIGLDPVAMLAESRKWPWQD